MIYYIYTEQELIKFIETYCADNIPDDFNIGINHHPYYIDILKKSGYKFTLFKDYHLEINYDTKI